MAIRFSFAALLGVFAAAVLSMIQLGEVNFWSLLFGYHVGFLMETMRTVVTYLQSHSKEMSSGS